MDLFNNSTNILPFDGEVIYIPNVLTLFQAQQYYQTLLNTIAWKNDESYMFGKHIISKRKMALYGSDDFTYNYANTTKQTLAWTPELLTLKEIIEAECNTNFNACLLNLYHNGQESMGWHADNEKEMGKQPIIASLSLGADRKFDFKHRATKQKVSVLLEKGSLLMMKGDTQTYWIHQLPKMSAVKTARINLTFRNIVI